jgi:hypothetical protein
MAKYWVNDNAQHNGDHEVHVEGCTWILLMKAKTYLGEHEKCQTAVDAAKSIYANVNGCKFCSPVCNTR